MATLLTDAEMGIGAGPPPGALLSDADMGIGPPKPAFGSDECVNDLAKKHGTDSDYVRRLTRSMTGGEILKGVPIAGALSDRAAAGMAAAIQPLTGAGAKGGSVSERYGKNKALFEELSADFEREHPYISTA